MALLSIIIPTLNEVNYIGKCLSTIEKNAQNLREVEVIVIDAGSSDKTLSLIPDDISIVSKPEFQGSKFKSLNAGAKLAKGKYLLFLDADTLVPKYFDQLIIKEFEDESIVAGAFEFSFIENTLSLHLIELINRFRYRVRKSYYGDQGIFVRKTIFDKVGGFPKIRLMEAAKFCSILRKAGKLCLIKECVSTSARRFEKGGILKVFLFDFNVWMRNIFGLDVEGYANSYWGREY